MALGISNADSRVPIDQFLNSTGQREISFAIEDAQVARSKPSVGKRLLVRFGIPRIAVHDVCSAHNDFTLVPLVCIAGRCLRATVYPVRPSSTSLIRG